MNRAHVERHAGAGAAWLMATRASCAAVRSVVPAYVGYEERSVAPVRRFEVPHPNVTVIINLGAPLDVHVPALTGGGGTFGSFAAGLFDTVVVTGNTGDSSGIELNLTPVGIWQLLGIRMASQQNRVIALDDLLGPAASRIEERLRNIADWDDRFDLLDAVLTQRLAHRTVPVEVQWAWSEIVRGPSHGSSRCTGEMVVAGVRVRLCRPSAPGAGISRVRRHDTFGVRASAGWSTGRSRGLIGDTNLQDGSARHGHFPVVLNREFT